MTIDELRELFEEHKVSILEWNGKCHDCGGDVTVTATCDQDGNHVTIEGGSVFKYNDKIYLKDEYCYFRQPRLTDFQPCEVYFF